MQEDWPSLEGARLGMGAPKIHAPPSSSALPRPQTSIAEVAGDVPLRAGERDAIHPAVEVIETPLVQVTVGHGASARGWHAPS